MQKEKIVALAAICALFSEPGQSLRHQMLYDRIVNYNNTEPQEGLRAERSIQRFPLPSDDYDMEPPSSKKTERDVHTPEFRPLCQGSRRRLELREIYGEGYEYRPPHLYESLCKTPLPTSPTSQSQSLMCVYPGFSCVQRWQTVYLTRRKFESACWESFSRDVASNCECMYPTQTIVQQQQPYMY